MTKNLKISLALVVIAVAAVLVIAAPSKEDGNTAAPTSPAEQEQRLVRDDSPKLTDGTEATFVEFLDFECEACGAWYPVIEDLKATYGDRISFVVRYMPLHTSSVNAAKAAEAAGEQGKYKEMFDILFQRQTDWGHKDTPEEQKLFGYAEELDLDMAQFRTDFDSAEVAARIEQSTADGKSLGVQGTPTMFLDGKKISPETPDDLASAFEAAVAK